MKIDDFLEDYELGNQFFELTYKKWGCNIIIDFPKEIDSMNTPLLYLLVCNNEIVYIGQTQVAKYRLRLHRQKLKIDHIYVMPIDAEKLNLEEQLLIEYACPILNYSKFTKYEQLYFGKPQSLDFVLGYINCLEKLNRGKKYD